MKRVIKASQYDIGDEYLQAKKYIDDAKQAMLYLQTIGENKADCKQFGQFAAQLGEMSRTLQSHLNFRVTKRNI